MLGCPRETKFPGVFLGSGNGEGENVKRRAGAIHSDTLVLLELEHERFGDVLGIVEDDLNATDHDLALLNQCLSYLLEFADTCHHPKEDMISRKLEEAGAEPGELGTDHERLHNLTEDLAIQTRNSQRITPTLIERLRQLVDTYKGHIVEENARFFPMARHTLSQDDFDVIDFSVFDQRDPLYDSAEESRFADLRREIVGRVA